MYEIYNERPLHKRVQMIPLYIMPILFLIFSYTQAVAVLIVIVCGGMFLAALWSSRIRVLFSMSRSNTKSGDYIMYEGKLCKLVDNSFEFEKSGYMLEEGKMIRLRANTKKTFGYFSKWTDRTNEFVEGHRLRHFKKNQFDIVPPTFSELFFEHAVSPLFVFQVFSGLLWCLDEYVYQAIFSLVMLFVLESGLVFQRMMTARNFKKMSHSSVEVKLLYESKKGRAETPGTRIMSSELFPGDVIEIDSLVNVPCDLLLINGACAVNEAMLSGESVPLMKEDISERGSTEVFDRIRDKRHILYAGTEIVMMNKSPLTCFVLHTGFETEKGDLVRKMMCAEEVTVNDKEAFVFIFALLMFAIVASFYTYCEGKKLGKSNYKLLLEVILILTNVVPTELPMELSMAVNGCVRALIGKGVYCLEPFRIPYAGKVNVCCFDKTGTLTETSMDVAGIKHQTIKSVDVLASCHSLLNINGNVLGDPMEVAVYEYMKKEEMSNGRKYSSIKTYSFSSETKRMSVVAEVDERVFVGMKGAPETVKKYLKNVPEWYDEYEESASEGYRVLALGHKYFDRKEKYDRDDVEEGLEFAGFLLFDCRLKKNVKETIDTLYASGHKVVMITGDNALTAKNVSKRIGISGRAAEGDEIDAALKSDDFFSISIFARADPTHKEKIIERYKNAGSYTLMCGDGTNDVGALKSAHVGIALMEAASVSKTNEKEAKKNGVGAKGRIGRQEAIDNMSKELSEPKVGLGDASVAAPFTAKTGSLESVLDVIRYGRSALVTTVQMYKILALNSLVSAFSLSVLDCMGVRYGETQLVASGLLIGFAFMFLTQSQPLKEISKKRPLTNIINPYIVLSVILQVSVHIGSFFVMIRRIKQIEVPVYQEKFSPSLMNSALFFLSTTQQISTFLVNYIGRPYRESLIENKKLLGCLLILLFLIQQLVSGSNEELRQKMEIVEIGDLKQFVYMVLVMDIFLCYTFEKVCFYMFML
ncbi:putative E1-E2 ATPase [Ordospora colligata]|uniref:Putative E1-E2 ATPase n=1 Tax=Ordospora colligata OC4 TaxID=1354746 RepID=A0A0B2UMF4_9MICR|nr:putative E1-E2 ATPase [Ordospora colligata OC4]KHN70222.1 putative E1-E2 ATPase [Ordospora colligata OC4]TBU16766.1 putative E1-E2 ATPase [Ordospora colligata]TBU17072.1 putative E1-E2 ATPase [Ordospora colligata]TBU19315.1 putative E1-E2 ATPase [Ordospora colligata]